MSDALFLVGDLILAVGAVGGIAFTVSYAALFNWRKTAAGRALLYFVVSLVAVFLSNLTARVMGYDYPFREVFRLVVYSTVTFTIWRLVYVLWTAWRRPPSEPPADAKPRREKETL